MKAHAWMLWLVVGLLGTVGALVVSRGWAEETYDVQEKPGEVEKNFDIDKDDEEEVAPESIDTLPGGKIRITTKTFKPPTGWKFKNFTRDLTPTAPYDRRPFNPGQYVDIEIDPECLPPKVDGPKVFTQTTTDPESPPAKEGEYVIKVVVTQFTVPPTAGNFPLKCEGNLEPPPGRGGGGGAKKEWHWSAKMSVIELDVRESSRHPNRVGRDDPRTPNPARNKLVLWHNDGNDTITFDVIKPPNIKTTFMVRVEDECGENGGTLPVDISLTADSHTFSNLNVAEDSDDCDLVVKYGMDSDESGTLSDAEVMDQYGVFGVTEEDYDESQNTLWLVLIGQFKLSNALLHRFTYGTWDPITYKPTSTADTVTLDAACTTHNFGATFAPTGFEEIKGRLYLKANVTMPVYYYASGSPASKVVREDRDFVDGLNGFIDGLTYNEIDTKYKAAGGVNNEIEEIEFANVDVNFNFSLFGGWVGLGHASGQVGGLTLYVWPAGENCYEIVAGSTIANTEVRDVYDFDYFNTGWGGTTGASRSGASVQCGFDMPGCVEGDDGKAGQVAYVRIMIDGEVATNSRIVEK